ncbi:MAG: fused response regulator/phosphatase [Pseudomonadota bacterium]|nr:fused response regulator/phosphatase [Pseudomonadota bacterium]
MTVRILVVDDEPDIEPLFRQRYRRQIRDGRYDMHFAGDGEEALAALGPDPDFELVLTDINMPRMDGLTLLERLRPFRRRFRTVVMSAYGDMSNIRTAMNRGAFDFITKPIDFADLDLTLEKAIREVEDMREAARILTEMESARRLQSAVLPAAGPDETPHPCCTVAAQLVPVSEVGGDVFDYYMADARRLFFVVGDVSGKGLAAALFMPVAKILFKSAVYREPDRPLSAILTEVNREIARDNPECYFVSVFAGMLDCETGLLQYFNGGLEPAWLVGADGARTRLGAEGGLPLSVIEDHDYVAGTHRMHAGETLVVTSDGLTEAQAGAIPFGAAGVEAVLAAMAPGNSPHAICDSLRTAVVSFAGGTGVTDDLTILSLRWTGP